MKPITRIIVLICSIAITLLSCTIGAGQESEVETRVAETIQVGILETVAADNLESSGVSGGLQVVTPSPTFTASPSATFTLTPTLVPTLEPKVVLSQDTNCRTGPALFYDLVFVAKANVEMDVVGVWAADDYYVLVRQPNSSNICWLWLEHANRKDFSGYGLQVFQTPPTPTPTETELATGIVRVGAFADYNLNGIRDIAHPLFGHLTEPLLDMNAVLGPGPCPYDSITRQIQSNANIVEFQNMVAGTYCVGFQIEPVFCDPTPQATTAHPKQVTIGPGETSDIVYIGFTCVK